MALDNLRRFLGDESGAMTVDFVVWLPLFVSLLVIVTDASILYLTQTEMWNVARDTVRRMTTQQLQSEAAAKCWAESEMSLYSHLAYQVDAQSSMQFNTVSITVALNDASSLGYFLQPVLGETISARVTMRADPTLDAALPENGTCPAPGNGGGGDGGKGKG